MFIRVFFMLLMLVSITSTLFADDPMVKTKTSILDEWDFRALMSASSDFRMESSFETGMESITLNGEISIDFHFETPPTIAYVDSQQGLTDLGNYGILKMLNPIDAGRSAEFKFSHDLPEGGMGVRIIFNTSDAQAQVPAFLPKKIRTDEKGTVFGIERFVDYPGDYAFEIQLKELRGFSLSYADLNWFSEGAEHHIYGDVQLFGAEFSNEEDKPLIFNISDGKYVWLGGKGTVTTSDGTIVKLGGPQVLVERPMLPPLAPPDAEYMPSAPSGDFVPYTARGFGFALDLPVAGMITSPSTAGWEGDKETAFEWTATNEGSVLLIQGIVSDMEESVDSATNAVYCDSLLEGRSEQPEQYEVLVANATLDFNGRSWSLIEIADYTVELPGEVLYYSLFSTYEGESFYTLMFYYFVPSNDEIIELCSAVLDSFTPLPDLLDTISFYETEKNGRSFWIASEPTMSITCRSCGAQTTRI